ncbi:MAG: hypothetical protein ACJ8GV_08330 [Luteimonas sp.]
MKPDDEIPDRDAVADAAPGTDPRTGIDSEVGDLEDEDEDGTDALPGHAGGGLAGG